MGPIIRIALRYIAGALVAYGLLPDDLARDLASDPDIISVLLSGIDWAVVLIGTALGAAVEWAYGFAKRRGWAT